MDKKDLEKKELVENLKKKEKELQILTELKLLTEQKLEIDSDLKEQKRKLISALVNLSLESFSKQRNSFTERIRKEYKEIEKYKDNEVLYSAYNEALKRETTMLFELLDEQVNNFIKTIQILQIE